MLARYPKIQSIAHMTLRQSPPGERATDIVAYWPALALKLPTRLRNPTRNVSAAPGSKS
jgi:hypothetical protein